MDAMLEELGELKKKWLLEGKSGKVDEIRKALTRTIEGSISTASKRNQIKKAKRKKMSKDKVGSDNIVAGKRRKGKKQLELPTFTPPPVPPAGMETNIDSKEIQSAGPSKDKDYKVW